MKHALLTLVALAACSRDPSGSPSRPAPPQSPSAPQVVTAPQPTPPTGVLARYTRDGTCRLTNDTVASEGTTVGSDDGCNHCRCERGGWACTEMACANRGADASDGPR